MPVPSQGHYVFTVFRLLTDFVCLYNYEFWLSLCKIVQSSVILLLPLFFILDEVFSVNTTCFVKTMVNARIVVTPLFQIIFQFTRPFMFVVCSLE
jgi:hypothetical protein